MEANETGQHKPNKPTVRIIVATHKKYHMPTDPIYLPLHIGAAIERTEEDEEPDLGYVKDNTGVNISTRNPYYCELTGLYWAWKHLHTDYIGLVHYRRYFKGDGRTKSGIKHDIFDKVLKYRELEPMLGQYKVFLPRKRHYIIETLYSHYDHTHYIEHLNRTREILLEKYPEYVETFDEVMKERSAHMFNMLIMRRDVLDEYCTWLFDILFELENRVDVTNYSYYQGRYSGRVGELILNVWIRQQEKTGRILKAQVKVLPYIYIEKQNWFDKGRKFLRAALLHKKYDT